MPGNGKGEFWLLSIKEQPQDFNRLIWLDTGKMDKNSQLTDSFLCSYYLCNGSRASPGKSGGLALLLALLWSLNLLWGATGPGNLLLVDLPSGAAKPSDANQRSVSQDEALPAGKGPFRDFEAPGLVL